MDRSKCIVCVPVGKYIEPGVVECLTALQVMGYRVMKHYHCPWVDYARNCLARSALDAGAEFVMWVDADVEFNPYDVDRLLQSRLHLVCGIYAKKSGKGYAATGMTDELLTGQQFGKDGHGELIPLKSGGMGFVMIQREVFDAISRRKGFDRIDDGQGGKFWPYFDYGTKPGGSMAEFEGEDHAFFRRCREAGFTLWADTHIELTHIGTYGYSWKDVYEWQSMQAVFAQQAQARGDKPRNGTIILGM